LEQALRDLPRTGKLVAESPRRQVWRFEYGGRPYYLRFYPHGRGLGWRLRRGLKGNPALREFYRLQWLQKAGVSGPRAAAALMGFAISGRRGDCVIIEGLEPAVRLDDLLREHGLSGEEVPGHVELVEQAVEILEKMSRARLGHAALEPGCFLVHAGKLYLFDAEAVHKKGLAADEILRFGASLEPHATVADLCRGWASVGPRIPPPKVNRQARVLWRRELAEATKNPSNVGRLDAGEWSGDFFKHTDHPRRWSTVSRLTLTEKDWAEAWPRLLGQLESDQFEVLKRTAVGDVLAGEIVLAGHPIPVVIKRPRRKFWYRYINEIGRGTRPRRAWVKAWQLVVRNIRTAWPMAYMEKRVLGYAVDALIVAERIGEHDLSRMDLNGLEAGKRETAFRRVGRLLRRLEGSGLYLYDSKASNWIVKEDEKLGPVPYIIDVDGLRLTRRSPRGGLQRLLRSLCERPEFTREDASALYTGYAPGATAEQMKKALAAHVFSAELSGKLPAQGLGIAPARREGRA